DKRARFAQGEKVEPVAGGFSVHLLGSHVAELIGGHQVCAAQRRTAGVRVEERNPATPRRRLPREVDRTRELDRTVVKWVRVVASAHQLSSSALSSAALQVMTKARPGEVGP